MTHTKGPEEYRRLADKCRETARTVSAEKERADLLAMAQTWDLIASRVGRAPRLAREPSGVIPYPQPRSPEGFLEPRSGHEGPSEDDPCDGGWDSRQPGRGPHLQRLGHHAHVLRDAEVGGAGGPYG